ncbi:SpaH/EbpB family LPXTG-anchored major pilin [Lacticaseibacillus thailandensis]|uniref:SpaH/EbpB family LPXTG-anchored major pilin n=1 Tax=Lacticaseibacillus thailandensis TaxID=381741 RepID=UPI0006CF4BF3|nr:SpaH/EbpB family LPXTG-anchored major pilin [Lacticaseibacillus thailandensis]
MNKSKIVHIVGVCGLALGALGAASAPVIESHFATVTAATTKNAVVADDTSTRSITLHKYTGQPAKNTDGKEPSADDVPADAKPLAGISFTVQKVTKVAGKTFDASDASTYTVDSSFTKQTATTDGDGTANIDLGVGTSADGYYLVTELPSDAVKTAAAPFIVHVPMTHVDATTGDKSLQYDVNIYPKNEVDTDSMNLNPTKTFDDGTTEDSVKSGAAVSWDLSIDRPSDIHGSGVETAGNTSSTVTNADGSTTTTDTTTYKTYASELKMTDKLDDDLMTYKDVSKVVISSPNSNGGMTDTALTADTDYKVTTAKADGSTTVTVELTDDGIKKLAAAPKGSKLTAKLETTVKLIPMPRLKTTLIPTTRELLHQVKNSTRQLPLASQAQITRQCQRSTLVMLT